MPDVDPAPTDGGQGGANPQPGAAPAPSPAPAPAPNDPAPSSWLDGIEDGDLRSYAEGKGWNDVNAALKSAKNLESMVRGDPTKIVRIPGEDADDAARNEFYSRLGRPEAPNGYELEVPTGQTDTSFADWAKEQFFNNGIPKAAGEALVKEFNQFAAQQEQKRNEDFMNQVAIENEQLEKEWGAAAEKNFQIAEAAVREFNIPVEIIDAIEERAGFMATTKFLHEIGAKLGEAAYIDNGGGNDFNGVMSPAEAKAKIAQLKSDPVWRKKHLAGDKSTKAELDLLHKYAYSKH